MDARRPNLLKALYAVDDEQSFIRFLTALRDDRKAAAALSQTSPDSPHGPDPGGWENTAIERFFEAAAAWGRDSTKGNQYYTKPDNTWRRCADILFAAIIYE